MGPLALAPNLESNDLAHSAGRLSQSSQGGAPQVSCTSSDPVHVVVFSDLESQDWIPALVLLMIGHAHFDKALESL